MNLTAAFRNFANAPKTVKCSDFKMKDRWCSLQKGEAGKGVDEGFAILGVFCNVSWENSAFTKRSYIDFFRTSWPLVFYNFYKQV